MLFDNGVESFPCVLFILSNFSLSLLACLSRLTDIWPCVRFLSLECSDTLESGARSRSFSTRFRDHDVISACMHQRGDRVEGNRGVAPATHVFVKGTCLLARRLGRVSCSNGVGWGGALVVHFIIEISAKLIARHDYSIVINVRAFLKHICYIALQRINPKRLVLIKRTFTNLKRNCRELNFKNNTFFMIFYILFFTFYKRVFWYNSISVISLFKIIVNFTDLLQNIVKVIKILN